jgi:nucleoside-diphosphate-sugar epimerase
MKIFVTGASGYIGKVVAEHAVRAGHVVEGLARNQEAAAKVSQLGATPAVGDLQSFNMFTDEVGATSRRCSCGKPRNTAFPLGSRER